MKFFIFILLYVAHCNGQMQDGIPVGHDNEYPYVVKVVLYYSENNLFPLCTGAIISRNYAITAAHCEPERDYRSRRTTIRLIAGGRRLSRGSRWITVNNVIQHPNYPHDRHGYDIALLRFTENLVFSDPVNSIPVVNANQRAIVQNVCIDFGDSDESDDCNDMSLSISSNLKKVKNPAKLVPTVGEHCKVISLNSGNDPQYTVDSIHIKKYDYFEIKRSEECYYHGYYESRNFCLEEGNNRGKMLDGDSGSPVVCTDENGDEKLYGVVIEADYQNNDYAVAVRLTNQVLNRWIRGYIRP